MEARAVGPAGKKKKKETSLFSGFSWLKMV